MSESASIRSKSGLARARHSLSRNRSDESVQPRRAELRRARRVGVRRAANRLKPSRERAGAPHRASRVPGEPTRSRPFHRYGHRSAGGAVRMSPPSPRERVPPPRPHQATVPQGERDLTLDRPDPVAVVRAFLGRGLHEAGLGEAGFARKPSHDVLRQGVGIIRWTTARPRSPRARRW